MDWSLILEIFGFAVGVVYLWWEYQADAKVWIASMVMPAISLWIYYTKGLYADCAINVYYLVIAVYGYWAWTRGNREKIKNKNGKLKNKNTQIRAITHVPLKVWVGIAWACGALWVLLWWLLKTLTDSTVPVADAFTTALSIVALWMMARKYAEQWLMWMVVDAVCVGLYLYKGLVLYPVLYTAYTVIAVLGYRKWCTMMKR